MLEQPQPRRPHPRRAAVKRALEGGADCGEVWESADRAAANNWRCSEFPFGLSGRFTWEKLDSIADFKCFTVMVQNLSDYWTMCLAFSHLPDKFSLMTCVQV